MQKPTRCPICGNAAVSFTSDDQARIRLNAVEMARGESYKLACLSCGTRGVLVLSNELPPA